MFQCFFLKTHLAHAYNCSSNVCHTWSEPDICVWYYCMYPGHTKVSLSSKSLATLLLSLQINCWLKIKIWLELLFLGNVWRLFKVYISVTVCLLSKAFFLADYLSALCSYSLISTSGFKKSSGVLARQLSCLLVRYNTVEGRGLPLWTSDTHLIRNLGEQMDELLLTINQLIDRS